VNIREAKDLLQYSIVGFNRNSKGEEQLTYHIPVTIMVTGSNIF